MEYCGISEVVGCVSQKRDSFIILMVKYDCDRIFEQKWWIHGIFHKCFWDTHLVGTGAKLVNLNPGSEKSCVFGTP